MIDSGTEWGGSIPPSSLILILKNNSTIFHHKYLISDPENGDSDPTVLTGSHNWSNAGEQRNDENTVVVHDLNIANQFHQEFAARVLQYGGATPCNFTAIEPKVSAEFWYVWQDASKEKLFIETNGARIGNGKVRIIDMAGRVMNIAGSTGTDGKAEINTRGLTPGIYMIRIECPTGIYSARWIK